MTAMTIIKKSGKKEPFSTEKFLHSIDAASKEAGENLSDAEIRRILAEFQQIVNGKERMTTQQIDVVINGLLYTKRYFGTLEHYVSYHKKRD